MSVALQSWEVASGPAVGYNMAAQGNSCGVGEGSKGPNFSNYRVHGPQDSLVRGLSGGAENSKDPNYWVPTPQDSVVWGISALSLYVQPHPEADVSPEDNRCMPLGKLRCASPELNRYMSTRSSDSTSLPPAGSQKHGKVFGSNNAAHSPALVSYNHESGVSGMGSDIEFIPHSASLNTAFVPHSTIRSRSSSTPMNYHPPDEHYGRNRLHGFSNPFWSPNSILDVVAEDKPWEGFPVPMPDDLEPDTISTASSSSFSSANDMPLDSSFPSSEGSQVSGDTEVESAYKGPSDYSSSPVGSSPPRKGLSRFYAGKSRSFSCLGDVVSLKDLAKPENPYARKRKPNLGSNANLDRPRLPPLQKGAASISKKSLHNGKSTLALAVAMSSKEGLLDIEEQESQTSLGTRRWQGSLVPSRSYSLSDLQGAAGCHFSPN